MRRSLSAVAAACFAAYGALCAWMYADFARTVPGPYMDEPFHVRQTQAYCAGRWHEWDDKITTFPGLYLIAATVARARGNASCSLPELRSLNLLPAAATPYLLHRILIKLHPTTSPADLLANTAVLALLPTHFFFHFLFYTDSLATCSVLLLLLLALPASRGAELKPSGLGRLLVRFLAAALAISLRQTNAVWVAFVAASGCLRELYASSKLAAAAAAAPPPPDPQAARSPPRSPPRGLAARWPSLVASLREVIAKLPSCVLPSLLRGHAAQLALLAAFAAFVVHNGGSVVLGDKAHHQPAFHLAQLLYMT
jgi:alpha-1,2-glucosyltransferase